MALLTPKQISTILEESFVNTDNDTEFLLKVTLFSSLQVRLQEIFDKLSSSNIHECKFDIGPIKGCMIVGRELREDDYGHELFTFALDYIKANEPRQPLNFKSVNVFEKTYIRRVMPSGSIFKLNKLESLEDFQVRKKEGVDYDFQGIMNTALKPIDPNQGIKKCPQTQ